MKYKKKKKRETHTQKKCHQHYDCGEHIVRKCNSELRLRDDGNLTYFMNDDYFYTYSVCVLEIVWSADSQGLFDDAHNALAPEMMNKNEESVCMHKISGIFSFFSLLF